MTGLLTAFGTAASCTAARWYLDRAARRERSYWGDRVRLTALWNRGAAFGLPVPARWLPAAGALALAGLLRWERRCPAGAGLVLGGGLSNLYERVRHRRVYDYLRFPKAPGPLGRYVYNLADLAIFAGAGALLLSRRRR